MKLDKGAILASMAIIMVASVLAGAGTMAWFSGTKTTGLVRIETGTFSMSDPTVTFSSTPPTNWAPGESFVVKIRITNTGTIDIDYLGGDLVITNDVKGLANVINVTSIAEWLPGQSTWFESMESPQDYWKLVGDEQRPLTLKELADSYTPAEMGGDWSGYHTTDWITGRGYDLTPDDAPAVPVGGTYEMDLTLKFMESAGNDYQGAVLKFQITFTACQGFESYPDILP